MTSEPIHAKGPPRQGHPPTLLSVQPVAERGGSDQALLRLTRQLTAAGWAVHVALPATSPMAADFASAGVKLHVVPMHRISTSHRPAAWLAYVLAWPKSVLGLWRLSRAVRADVRTQQFVAQLVRMGRRLDRPQATRMARP